MTKKQVGFMAAVAGALVLVGAACDPGDGELPVASVVFASSFSKNGRFQVSQSPDGRLAVAITGRAGEDNPETIARAVGTKSLIAMHRALHPGTTSVPPQLQALEQRYALQFAESGPPAATGVATETQALVIRKPTPQEQAFRRDHCRERQGPGFIEIVESCRFDSDSGRFPDDPPPNTRPLRKLCTEKYIHRNQILAQNFTDRGAVLYQEGGSNAPSPVNLAAGGGFGFLTFYDNSEALGCLSTRGRGGMGISRHTLLDVPQ